MYDKKNDYARNKRSENSIVYAGTTGTIELKREDFNSEEEFQNWKHWSDEDYRHQSKSDRPYWDRTLLIEDWSTVSIAGDPPAQKEAVLSGEMLIVYAKRCLSTKQYCRLMLYVSYDGVSVWAIAIRYVQIAAKR